MTCKKIKKLRTPPTHGTSLVDAEEAARSNLATPGSSRKKEKVVSDPSLGADLTKKIMRSAIKQIEEDERSVPSVPLQFTGPDEGEDDSDDDQPLEIDLETNDEESRQLFEMFRPDIEAMSKRMDKTLERTRHQADPEVRRVYSELGLVMKMYKSGALPKAVKVLASGSVQDWRELMDMSEPENWSIAALHEVTVLFAQSGSDAKCEVFFQEVLLEYVREILERSRKLKPLLFQSMVVAARRPKPFVFGVLLPLSQERQCTMKEARVISAIVGKVKLPRVHANAFIIKICSSEITVTRTIFLARMINKGQALAVQAIDAIVAYFLGFMNIDDDMPLLWHRATLDFVKKYGKDLIQEQREALIPVFNKHRHGQITAEIQKLFREVPPREEQVLVEEFIPEL